jgi:transcriptional regulator with XRE-family HTH domain
VPNEFELIFAERMNIVRQLRGLTIEHMASSIGVTARTYEKYENGFNGHMRINRTRDISLALNCSPAYLMGWIDDNSKYFYLINLREEERHLIVSKDMLIQLDVDPEELESFSYLHINTEDDLTDDEIIEAYKAMRKLKMKA